MTNKFPPGITQCLMLQAWWRLAHACAPQTALHKPRFDIEIYLDRSETEPLSLYEARLQTAMLEAVQKGEWPWSGSHSQSEG